MSEKEIVLELGTEGGGSTIYRSQLSADSWEFHIEGTSIFMDENDDEDWRSWVSGPFLTIQDALRSIAKGGSWICYYPLFVHPEYRKLVWEIAQQNAGRLSAELKQVWKKQRWQSLCLETE